MQDYARLLRYTHQWWCVSNILIECSQLHNQLTKKETQETVVAGWLKSILSEISHLLWSSNHNSSSNQSYLFWRCDKRFHAKPYSPYLQIRSHSNPRWRRQGGLMLALEWIVLLHYHIHSLALTVSPEIHIPHDHPGVLRSFHTIGYRAFQLEELYGHQKKTEPAPSYLTEVPNNRSCSLLEFPNNSLQWD